MDTDTSDQRLEHHRNPPEFVSLEDLFKKTGVEYFKVRSLIEILEFLADILSITP